MSAQNQNSNREVSSTLSLVWPLLASMFLIMVGGGLQGTLLSLRGKLEGFPSGIIGLVMALYYFGFALGWFIVPNMIRSVGHIRVFAGFASMASTTILIQGLFVDPWLWGVVRLITGLSFVSLFIVAESWLNDIAPNRVRGQVLSAYFFTINGGLFCGQFLLNLAPIDGISLFILISILLSFSLVPITLANRASPGYEEPEKLPLSKLFRKSPLSIYSVMLSGFAGAAIVALGPIYAEMIGYDAKDIALFVAIYVLGSSTIPLVTGKLSDSIDRRLILVLSACVGALLCLTLFLMPHYMMWGLFGIGGVVAAIYATAIAMMNDRIKQSQITSATASLILLNGMSACFSPIILGFVLQYVGTDPFFVTLGCLFALMFVYGLYRSYVGPEIDVEDQGDFQPIPSAAGGIGMADMVGTDIEFEDEDSGKTLLERVIKRIRKKLRFWLGRS